MTPRSGDKRGRGQKGHSSSPRALGIRQKENLAVKLRNQGKTLAEVAAAVGYTDASAASKAIQRCMARVVAPDVAERRAEQDAHIAAALSRVGEALFCEVPPIEFPEGMDSEDAREWAEQITSVLNHNWALRLRASREWVRLLERRAKLHGLDAPVKAELSGPQGQVTVVFSAALAPVAPATPVVVDAV